MAGGARAIVLTNQKGAVLELSGRQVGLMAKRRPEGACDHDEVDGCQASARNRNLFDAIIASRNPPTLRRYKPIH